MTHQLQSSTQWYRHSHISIRISLLDICNLFFSDKFLNLHRPTITTSITVYSTIETFPYSLNCSPVLQLKKGYVLKIILNSSNTFCNLLSSSFTSLLKQGLYLYSIHFHLNQNYSQCEIRHKRRPNSSAKFRGLYGIGYIILF
jgi:hypothetical protein